MKKKYGFTLIELLAVITVLSIVALIALPLVVNNIDEEKKHSARISTNEYIKSFHSTIVEVMADNVDKASGLYTVNSDGTISIHNQKYDVSIKGDKPTDGRICVSNQGDVTGAYLKINGYIMSYDGENVEQTDMTEIGDVDCDILDKNTILVLRRPNVTTKSITVPYLVSDTVSGIDNISCFYGTDEKYKLTGELSSESCNLNNLKNNTLYYYKISAKNNDGTTTTKVGSVKTKDFSDILISLNPTGWQSSKRVNITGSTEGAVLEYKLKKYNYVTKTYDVIDWTKYDSGFTLSTIATPLYPTTIYARLNDGVNTKNVSYNEVKIDPTIPELSVIKIDKTTRSIKLPYSVKDDESGIKNVTCVYGIDKKYGSTGTIKSSTCELNNLKSGVIYYYKLTATNNAGLVKEITGNTASEPIDQPIDITSPSVCAKMIPVLIRANIPSGASLQYRIGNSGSWTSIKSGISIDITSNTTIYARLYDGLNASAPKTHTITKIDLEKPGTNIPSATSTTNSITVTNNQTDNCGLNTGTLQYGISESASGTYRWQTSNKFTGLKANTTYYVKTRVNDIAGNGLTESVVKNIQTKSINYNPSIVVSPSACSKTKSVTINVNTVPEGANLQYRFGNGSWNNISNGSTITATSNTVVYARLYDGINSSATITYTITTIDTQKPSTNMPSATSTTNSITVTNNQTDNCGLNTGTLQYGISESASGTYRWQTGNKFTGLKANTTYYVKTRVNDIAGNGITEGSILTIKTKPISYNVSVTPLSSTCAKTRNLKITAEQIPSGVNLQYQVGTTTGTWTNISNNSQITIKENTVVYARLWDGVNASATATGKVTVDLEKPSTNIPGATSTTNSITVTNNQTDNCGLNTGTLQYGISESTSGTYRWQANNKFTGLKANTTYYVKTRVNDIAGNGLTESVVKNIPTKSIDYKPSIVVSPSACSKTKSVKISVNTVPEGVNLQYRFGNGSWNNIGNGSTITATYNTTVYARLYDGVNSSATITYTITTMDTQKPSTSAPSATSKTNNIVVTNKQTDNCGINSNTLQYGISSPVSTGSTVTYTWQSSNNFTGLKANTKYYVKTRVNDIAGNGLTESEATLISTESIDYYISISASSSCSKTKLVSIKADSVPSGVNLQYQLGSVNGNWTNISNGTVISLNYNTTVYARLYDGVNSSSTKTYTITTIDTERPSTYSPSVSNYVSASSNTNVISVTNRQTDNCGLDYDTLQYGISTSANGTYTWQHSSQFTNLADSTTYYIKTRVNDIAGNGLTESGYSSVKTQAVLKAPTITINTAGWAKSKTASIKYINGNTYYFRSNVSAKSNVSVVPCGSSNEPGYCQETYNCGTSTQTQYCSNATTNLQANVWYRTTSSSPVVTYTSNGTLTAMAKTSSLSKSSSATISQIDNTNPWVEYSVSGNAYGNGYQSGVTVTATCKDSISYASGSTSRTFTSGGTNWISGTCRDSAGNSINYSKSYIIYIYGESSSCGYNSCDYSYDCSYDYDCGYDEEYGCCTSYDCNDSGGYLDGTVCRISSGYWEKPSSCQDDCDNGGYCQRVGDNQPEQCTWVDTSYTVSACNWGTCYNHIDKTCHATETCTGTHTDSSCGTKSCWHT